MFGDKPEKYIGYSYVEIIVDMFGTKRKMDSQLCTTKFLILQTTLLLS